MRKLLLATVAVMGASSWVASHAYAQIVSSTDGSDSNVVDNTDGQSFPTPGQITVRLNGRFRFFAGIISQGALRTSANPPSNSNPAVGGTTVQAVNTSSQGLNRLSNYGFTEYARLYPGFDGVAANGLKYGASLEIRQDNNFGAGGGVYGSTTGQDRTRGILYYRREFGYIGTDRFGTIRVGSTDQPTSLYVTGTFENFNDGGANGDVQGFFADGGIINWPFNDAGQLYSTNKVVYLSPQLYGIDGGVSFEPSTAGIGGDNGAGCAPAPQFGNTTLSGAGQASPGCDALASTSTADYARRKNTYEGLLRYRGTFGAFGIAATAAYIGSGRVEDSGIQGSATLPKRERLEDLSYGDFGLVLTYGGLSFGGHYEVGRYNVLSVGGAGGLLARGQPNSNAFTVGATYTIGQVIFGASYLESFYEGNQIAATNRSLTGVPFAAGTVTGGQRRDQAIATGATYSLAPGVSIYLSYLYQRARQNGVNLVNGTVNVGGTSDPHNRLDGSVYAVGTSFAW